MCEREIWNQKANLLGTLDTCACFHCFSSHVQVYFLTTFAIHFLSYLFFKFCNNCYNFIRQEKKKKTISQIFQNGINVIGYSAM